MSESSRIAFFTTSRGIEDLCARELNEQLSVFASPRPFEMQGWVQANVNSILQLAEICYRARTIHRGMLLLNAVEIPTAREGLDAIYDAVKMLNLDEWLDRDVTFAIRSERKGKHAFQSPDIMRVAGQAVIDAVQERYGYRQCVNLDDPDIILRVDVAEQWCIISVDFVGEESLHRRGYRVYHHPAALRSTLACAMLMLCNWKCDKQLVDPLCGSGTIVIEAALMAGNVPPGFYRKDKFAFRRLLPLRHMDWDDWMSTLDAEATWRTDLQLFASDRFAKHVDGARRNAERALVAETIQFRVLDVGALDDAFERESIDFIITNPPYGIRVADPRETRRVHHRLFGAAQRTLKLDGYLTLIGYDVDMIQECADVYGFRIRNQLPTRHGNLPVTIFIMERR